MDADRPTLLPDAGRTQPAAGKAQPAVDSTQTAPAGRAPARRRRWPWALAAGMAALVGVVAVCESQGWPFLAQPAQRWLVEKLGRPVQLAGADGQGFQLHLWGPIRLSVDTMRIDNPAWSTMGPMLAAQGLQLSLRWQDALAWRPGRSLALQTLSADRVDLQLQRLADGRASWMLGPPDAAPAPQAARQLADLLTVQRVAVAAGQVQLQDAQLALQLDGHFNQGPAAASATGPSGPQQPGAEQQQTAGAGKQQPAGSLRAEATGSYLGKPLRASLHTGSPSGWLSDAQALDTPLPFTLSVHAGQASLGFSGEVQHLFQAAEIVGRYRLSGPSLAAVGAPLGITLPQTRRFDMGGRLVHDGNRWYTVVDQATVGSSRLGGAFVYERKPGQLPMLSGQLTGPALLLQDLGPAVGGATETKAKQVRANGRVLPDRRFNLPSLRAMNAQVLVALDKLDFGTPQLKSAAPLRANIRLTDGVLAIEQLQATLAQGMLSGRVRLDGRQAPALWDVDLSGRNLAIEQWLLTTRRTGQAPYATGRLNARLTLTGRGNSTAELLASADGRLRMHWRDGQISHLLVEAAGLDIAQGLGVVLRGDAPLPVICGAADLRVKDGVATPDVMLVDTRDSLLWLDGSASMATERLQMQAHVRPKDWSPLTLRAPLHIDGMLGAPLLSLDKPKLLQRAVPAALLALVHPLAALLPLIDAGDDTGPTAAGCQALVKRFKTSGLTG